MNIMSNMLRIILFHLLCLTGLVFSFEQAKSQSINGFEYCSQRKSSKPNLLQLKALSPNSPVHSYNVLNYKINVDLINCFTAPYSKAFTGDVTIRFKANEPISYILLDASSTSLGITSVSLDGVSIQHSNNILRIDLSRTFQSGQVGEVKINYLHVNIQDYAFYAKDGMIFTDCEPEGARFWFPCWDKPSDKATMELFAKVPANVLLGSNGKLISETPVSGGKMVNWKSRDSISTYLISMVAKVNYQLDFAYWNKISNPSEKVPIYFYYNQGENVDNAKVLLPEMFQFFSEKFGEHPFEKNGFATLNSEFSWGGMENQTLTSLCTNCWTESLLAHEFAHQWFGDMITCATWADLWINEGFATYLEMLWNEHKYGKTVYRSTLENAANKYLASNSNWAISEPSWAVTLPSTNTLFNVNVTYYKGACVLHMLRYVLGDDKFFDALKKYATDETNFKFQNATIKDFISKLNTVTGQDMNWFFDQWIFSPNHPVYYNSLTVNSLTNGKYELNYTLNQTQTKPAFFKMPVELKVTFENGTDTIMYVLNDKNNQLFNFVFAKKPVNVLFDPSNQIVLKRNNSPTSVFETKQNSNIQLSIFPNPAFGETKIKFFNEKAGNISIEAIDVNGKSFTIYENSIVPQGDFEFNWNTQNISSGLYIIQLKTACSSSSVRCLVQKQ